MIKNSVNNLIFLPVLLAGITSGVGAANAADIGLPTLSPTCGNDLALCNKWSGAITISITPRSIPGAINPLDYVFDFDFGSDNGGTFVGTVPTVLPTTGIGAYGVLGGTGAFDGFESTSAVGPGAKGFTFQDLILSNLILTNFGPAGQAFMQLDPQTLGVNSIPLGLGPDTFFMVEDTKTEFASTVNGSTLRNEFLGYYNSGNPAVSKQYGNIVITLSSPLSENDLIASVLTPAACTASGAPFAGNPLCGVGVQNQTFSVTGSLIPQATPEPGVLSGLAVLAGLGLFMKDKRSKIS